MLEVLESYKRGQILLIDKPSGWTSFDVVNKIRYQVKTKVGHGGTLDPLATGLLIIATGKKTKSLQNIQAKDKSYTGKIVLGNTTPSYDLETDFDGEYPYEHIDNNLINNTLKKFIGEIEQIPPKYSALKINGQRAYKKVRKEQEFEMKTRKVQIHEFKITRINFPCLEFEIRCSKGTYIRSIAHDFGKALGSGAYLKDLRRTAIDMFKIEDALQLDEFINNLNKLKDEA